MPVTQNPTIDLTERDVTVFYLTGGSAIFACTGSPEGVILANKQSLAISDNGSAYVKTTDNATTGWQALGGGGSGTVTSLSVGNLSPLFTSVVTNPTTTPSVAFTAVSQSANLVYASPNGSVGVPSFRSIVAADLPGLASAPTNGIQYNDGTNNFAASTAFLFDPATTTQQIGLAGSVAGKIQIRSAVSGSVQLTVGTPSAAHNYIYGDSLPATGDLWRAASVSGNNITLGFVAPSALGFPSINATDNVIPYRVNSTSFGDSQLTRTNSTTLTITDGVSLKWSGAQNPTIRYNSVSDASAIVFGVNSVDRAAVKSNQLSLNNDGVFSWSSNASTPNTSQDTGLTRLASGIVRVSNAGTGAGQLVVGSSVASTSNQFLVDSQSASRIAGYFTMQSSPTVPTIKAEVSAIQSFAFYPSGKLQGGMNSPTCNQQFSAIGNAKSDVSTIGNVGTGVDNLLSFVIPANCLANTGDYAEFDAFGEFENNANNKNLSIVFGSTTIFTTGALPFGTAALANWRINAKIVRTAASGQKCIVTFQCNDATTHFKQTITTSGEDLTANKTVQFTGEATANNDVTQLYLESRLCVAQTS